jgi:hypothetical protein
MPGAIFGRIAARNASREDEGRRGLTPSDAVRAAILGDS